MTAGADIAVAFRFRSIAVTVCRSRIAGVPETAGGRAGSASAAPVKVKCAAKEIRYSVIGISGSAAQDLNPGVLQCHKHGDGQKSADENVNAPGNQKFRRRRRGKRQNLFRQNLVINSVINFILYGIL